MRLYEEYAKDVLDGKIVACEAIKLACQRFTDWFSREDIYFDFDRVDYLIKWVAKMKHTKAPFTGKPFKLLPWLQFVVANIFGWKYKADNHRVTTDVFIMISRKAGKTLFAAALCLICAIAEKEIGAEVEILANSRELAKIAFSACKELGESLDRKGKLILGFRDKINIPMLKSVILVLSTDTATNDGYNASCFIVDEFHQAKDWNLYNVFKSSLGMREQPLSIIITTAGFLLSGYPCYDMRLNCIDILKGVKEDDSQFSAIYELDEEDDWRDESVWEKCQPSLNLTVKAKYMRDLVKAASNQPSMEVGVKTKNFNMFCQSETTWIPDEYVAKAQKRIHLGDFESLVCYVGIDLSSVSDMTALAVLFPPDKTRDKYPDKFVFKTLIYLPTETIKTSVNKELYKYWNRNKHLIATDGNVTDYNVVLKDLLNISLAMEVVDISYDLWNATLFAIDATNAGLPMNPYSQSIGNFTRPTKEFERLMLQGKVVIDDNPINRWALANCKLKVDINTNVKPVKCGNERSNKIDPCIAMLQALGGYLDDGVGYEQ